MEIDAWLVCIGARWQPTIGDPHLMGWLTVAVYGLAGLVAVWAGAGLARSSLIVPSAERWFWPALAAVMLVMMLNKQLDLQSMLTAAGRCLAMEQGWYADRRSVQIRFIAGLAVGGVLVVGVLLVVLRRSLARLWLAILGFGVVVTFVIIRAVGFHHVDALIGLQAGVLTVNRGLELGGLALIVLGALLPGLRYRTAPTGRLNASGRRRG